MSKNQFLLCFLYKTAWNNAIKVITEKQTKNIARISSSQSKKIKKQGSNYSILIDYIIHQMEYIIYRVYRAYSILIEYITQHWDSKEEKPVKVKRN